MSGVKRRAPTTPDEKSKKAKLDEAPYCDTPSVRDESGEIIWPAPNAEMENARNVIRQCAIDLKTTVICPDKDADGLTAGAILHRTLTRLGLPGESIHVHVLRKGTTVHDEVERNEIAAQEPSYVFVLDHGSRNSPAMLPYPHTALVIDHHFVSSDSDFPAGAHHVNACSSPPVATTSLLTFEICKPLHESVAAECDWLCAIGTHGDLGNDLKWMPPFPDMSTTFRTHTKKSLNDATSLLNAPRRTASYNVQTAWDALVSAQNPASILQDKKLLAARAEVNAEVDRCKAAAPKFSKDGRVAVIRMSSQAQVHPVIATRWARTLKAKKLEFVLAANEGYTPGKVNFSCRLAKASGSEVDIIRALKDIAAMDTSGTLRERLGADFARGHVQASGGIVGTKEFEEMMELLKVGEKPDKVEGDGKSAAKSPAKNKILSTQKNTLANYFNKG